MTVLYADDDVDDLDLFKKVVESLNPHVKSITFNDGVEIVDFLEKDEILPEFIFLDLNMPGMDGFECLERIKSQPRFRKIQIIILSTSGEKEDKEKSLQLGAASYIQKPCTYHEWRDNLKMYIAPDVDKTSNILSFTNLLHNCLHSFSNGHPSLPLFSGT